MSYQDPQIGTPNKEFIPELVNTKVINKEYSWNQEIEAENQSTYLTSKSVVSPANKEALTDISNLIKGESSTLIAKIIKQAKPHKLNPQPNLAAALKRKMKPNTKDSAHSKVTKNTVEEELEINNKQLIEENKKLKQLLEESNKRDKESYSQITQNTEQYTPNINIKNRFQLLDEDSLSTHDVMETEEDEMEERTFVQTLKKKNRTKSNNNSSHLSTDTQV